MLDDKKTNLPDLKQADQVASHPGQPAYSGNPDMARASFKNKYRSDKQREASCTNGRKSQGPTSQDGKQKAAQNAVQDGIFSRQIVIPELGETREDFDRFKATSFEYIRPEGALEEQFAMDVAENMFVRDRVRRAEELERTNRLNSFQLENELRRSDQLDKLRHRFMVQLEDHIANCCPSSHEIPEDLEQTRRELVSTSEGVDFLLELLEQIEGDLQDGGVPSAKQQAVVQAIRGCGHPFDVRSWIERLLADNSAASLTEVTQSELKSVRQEPTPHAKDDLGVDDQPPGGATSDFVRIGFAALMDSVDISLSERREKLKRLEDAETQKQITLIMLDPSPNERFSRAETSRERKMYRALAAITALRATSPLSLPMPVGPKDKELPGLGAKRTREAPTRWPTASLPEQATMVDSGVLLNKEVPPPPS
jgi:hypothetical protein